MASYKEVGQKITEMVINAVNSGEKLPWVKPWKGGQSFFNGGAISYATGKPYSLLNQFFLGGGGEWITFKECVKLGVSVKGQKAHRIFFGSMVKKTVKDEETGEERIITFPMYKEFNVFNIKDLGIPSRWNKEEKPTPIVSAEDIPIAEDVINAYIASSGITFRNNVHSNSAYYSPTKDEVVVPNKEQFSLMNEYYSTTFHELTHSTLKKNRCNRPQSDEGVKACFGNAPYAKEELVAELGSCMMLTALGISTETTERNSTAYLQDWLSALKNDTSLLLSAMGKAEKAVKFIKGETEVTSEVA